MKDSKDFETDQEPVIWVKLKLPGNKTVRIQNWYRQWRQVDSNGKGIPGTETNKSQQSRFLKVALNWAELLKQGETISLSDSNIDLNSDFNNIQSLSESEKKLIQIYRIFQEHIFNNGASAIPTKPTKIYYDKPYSYIDHLVTNWPSKIVHHELIREIFSDHLAVKFTLSNKKVFHAEKYRIIRDFKSINWDDIEF